MFNEDSSYSSDSYSKYTSNPSNKHDDSKLRDKFGTTQYPPPPERTSSKSDPYRFTRSTAEPYKVNDVNQNKLNTLSSKYRYKIGGLF